MRVVIIGVGSESFGRGMLADFFNAKELHGRGAELVLVDLDEERLGRMMRLAEAMKQHTGADYRVSSTTDRREALPGAQYVLTAVAQQRWSLWEQDYRIPMAYGFRHVLGENGGPGALFHALRSLHLMMPICRDMEELCPGALLLNFTNPEARVLHAISHLTKVKALGLCHGVFGAERWISRYLDIPREQIELTSAGLNHFYCVLRAVDRQTGQDRLPEALEKVKADESAHPLFRRFAQLFDVFTFPSDDHTGEYVSFGAEYHDGRWPYGKEAKPVGPEVRFQGAVAKAKAKDSDAIDALLEGAASVTAELLRGSGELAVPAILDIELNRGMRRQAVNVLNTEGYIENLPRRAAVEVPAMIDAKGVHPIHVGALPEAMAAYMRTQISIHELVTEAYRTGSRKLALQALLLDPCVNSIAGAEKLLNTMLELQKEYLPPLA